MVAEEYAVRGQTERPVEVRGKGRLVVEQYPARKQEDRIDGEERGGEAGSRSQCCRNLGHYVIIRSAQKLENFASFQLYWNTFR